MRWDDACRGQAPARQVRAAHDVVTLRRFEIVSMARDSIAVAGRSKFSFFYAGAGLQSSRASPS